MEYDRSDYEALFGEHYKPKPWTLGRLMLLVIILGAIFVSWGIAGCDFQAAQATQEAVRVADEKKEVVMGMPCTWVAQCGNPISDCPVTARKCVDADLRNK